jgi:hypothetical protein
LSLFLIRTKRSEPNGISRNQIFMAPSVTDSPMVAMSSHPTNFLPQEPRALRLQKSREPLGDSSKFLGEPISTPRHPKIRIKPREVDATKSAKSFVQKAQTTVAGEVSSPRKNKKPTQAHSSTVPISTMRDTPSDTDRSSSESMSPEPRWEKEVIVTWKCVSNYSGLTL